MKTSVIDVRDMLSVLSVDEVEKRIGDVPGVESVTVNYAAGSATVRYDETRLEITDIRSVVRQSGYESATPAVATAGGGQEGHAARGAPPATSAAAAPKTTTAAPATAGAASAGVNDTEAFPGCAESRRARRCRACGRQTKSQCGAGQKLDRHASCVVAMTRLGATSKTNALGT